jgi:tetratricopeptide (TPR) repeat protein
MRRSLPKPLLAVLAFLVATPVSLWSQGQIIGEVHVNQGDLPGPVLVELQFRGAPITSVYTDTHGKFGFGPLDSNMYHVVIRDERFYPVDEQAFLDLSISATLMVQIHLTMKAPEKKDAPVNRGPGSNPNLVDAKDYRRNVPKAALKEFDKAVEADRKGNMEEAIRHYQRSLAIASDFYPAHNNLGSVYSRTANFPAAQAQFEEAIKLNGSDAEARLNLGNVFLMTRNYDAALDNVQEGLRRAPQSPFGYFLLGSIYKQTGKLPEAEHALREALDLDPAMSRVRLELVNIYLTQGKKTNASQELRAFLEQSPQDPLAPKARDLLKKLETNPN